MPLLTCLADACAACGFVLGAVFSVEQADGGEELGAVAAQLFLTVHDFVEDLIRLGEEAVVLGEERLNRQDGKRPAMGPSAASSCLVGTRFFRAERGGGLPAL
jgi:hypothetical protein